MSEKPIIFSTPMVQAIKLDWKTQTRRIVNPQPFGGIRKTPFSKSGIEDNHGREIKPRYKVGDILWVRETHHVNHTNGIVTYRADYYRDPFDKNESCDDEFTGDEKWIPSIFMPKKLARIWLEVTKVRIDKLQDISRADAISEGLDRQECVLGTVYREYTKTGIWNSNPIVSYQLLWNSINGKSESKSWEANPYVWVYEFKRINHV